jgi:hypothetical protein
MDIRILQAPITDTELQELADARFYFANLTADVARAVRALQKGDQERYVQAKTLARRTLMRLREAHYPAYEEGLLLMRALTYAADAKILPEFLEYVGRLGAEYSPRTP